MSERLKEGVHSLREKIAETISGHPPEGKK